MGLFSTTKSTFNWQHISSISQMDEILALENKIVIFKHSTTCSISAFALKNFEREFDTTLDINCYYVDLLNHRDVSNAIAEKLDIIHQSPQVFLVENGTVLYTASHERIDATKIK